MSEYISKLEGYADLEVSIIRQTKINKVLKAILKLAEIPKEGEFQFKDRSKSLLEKWNKILESAEQLPPSATTPGPVDESSSMPHANGISAESKADKTVIVSNVDTGTAKPDNSAQEESSIDKKPVDDSVKVNKLKSLDPIPRDLN